MKKLLSIPGYFWALLCLLIIPVTFIKNDELAKQLTRLSFMKVHPVYSGGELNKTYESGNLLISVNHPVQSTIWKKSSKQIVQVAFSSTGALPELIEQTIDYNFDDVQDFKISVNTTNGKTEMLPLNKKVKSLYASSKVKEKWIVRVNLE